MREREKERGRRKDREEEIGAQAGKRERVDLNNSFIENNIIQNNKYQPIKMWYLKGTLHQLVMKNSSYIQDDAPHQKVAQYILLRLYDNRNSFSG